MALDPERFADIVAQALELRLAPVLARLAAVEARALVPGPAGRDGLNGKDGSDGRDGRDGKDGVDGKDGADGLHGKDGAPGRDGKDGADGLHGKDGAPGLDGKDGTLDDLDISWVGERTIRFARKDGTILRDRTIPLVLYRGVWDAARTYEEGDQVTCQGSTWIAKETTTQRPDDDGPGTRAWTLCSKRGAVGPRGPEGKPGVAGKDGAPGRDLTAMDSTGRKW
jgi:integrin beta 3